jgi:hypothetical protein
LATDYKRGLRRLHLVLSIGWVLVALVGFPLHERHKAVLHREADLRDCTDQEHRPWDQCWKDAEPEFEATIDAWGSPLRWPYLLIAVLPPLLVYALVPSCID